jgi:hypothetical protein
LLAAAAVAALEIYAWPTDLKINHSLRDRTEFWPHLRAGFGPWLHPLSRLIMNSVWPHLFGNPRARAQVEHRVPAQHLVGPTLAPEVGPPVIPGAKAVMLPDGLPIWASQAMPGHLHDTSCARDLGVTAALDWAAAELDLPTLADSGYESTGHGIKTTIKQPADGSRLALDNRTHNRLLRRLRWQGDRGFAILIGRWKTLRHTIISPRRIGDIVTAALHLTDFEYKYLPQSR